MSEIIGGKVRWVFIAQSPGFVLERAGWNISEKAGEGADGGGAWAGLELLPEPSLQHRDTRTGMSHARGTCRGSNVGQFSPRPPETPKAQDRCWNSLGSTTAPSLSAWPFPQGTAVSHRLHVLPGFHSRYCPVGRRLHLNSHLSWLLGVVPGENNSWTLPSLKRGV